MGSETDGSYGGNESRHDFIPLNPRLIRTFPEPFIVGTWPAALQPQIPQHLPCRGALHQRHRAPLPDLRFLQHSRWSEPRRRRPGPSSNTRGPPFFFKCWKDLPSRVDLIEHLREVTCEKKTPQGKLAQIWGLYVKALSKAAAGTGMTEGCGT